MTSEEEPEEATPAFALGDLLSHVQEMQHRLEAAQAEAAEMMVEGKAGGGAVVIQATGGLEFRSVKIDPKVFAEGDVTMLEDLVLAAINGVLEGVSQLNASAMHDTGLDDLGAIGDLDSMFGGMFSGGALGGGPEPEDGAGPHR